MPTTQQYRLVVAETLEWVESLLPEELLNPDPACMAGLDRAYFKGVPELAKRMRLHPYLVGLNLLGAASSLRAIARCVDLPASSPPVATMARSVIEVSAFAQWTTDFGVSPDERAARVAAQELHALEARRKLVLSEPSLLQRAQTDLSRFAAQMQTASVQPAARPSATDRVGAAFDQTSSRPEVGKNVYRVLCAWPHGGWQTHSAAPVFNDPMFGAVPAVWAFFDAFHALLKYVGWQATSDWVVWAHMVQSSGLIDFA